MIAAFGLNLLLKAEVREEAPLTGGPKRREKLGRSIGRSGMGRSAGTPLPISYAELEQTDIPIIEQLECDGRDDNLP
jgi:hypothetical protein